MSDEPVTRFSAPVRLDYRVRAGQTVGQFLRHVMEGRLVGRRCPSCTKVYLPPRGACPTCGVRTTEEIEVGPGGTVTTFSVIRIPFEGQLLEPPYACAHILVDGTSSPMLHIIGECDVDDVRMGLRVEPVWDDEPRPTLERVRYFRPNGEDDVPYEQFQEHV
jgi:uncharacterized OB-fold protein